MNLTKPMCTVTLLAIHHIALWTDCRFRRIPNRLILSGAVCAILAFAAEALFLRNWLSFGGRLAAGGAAGMLHGLPYLGCRMGAGDLKLAVVTGILLGWAQWTLYLFYYGWVMGAAVLILFALPSRYRPASLPMALLMAISIDLCLWLEIGL